MRFVPFPGPSSSGKQVLGKRTVLCGLCILITSLVSATRFPECATRAPSQVCHESSLGSRSLAVTLLADVNHPRSQEDLVSNWEPAHSLVENAISGAVIAPLPFGSGCCPAASLPPVGEGPVHSGLALLWYLVNTLFCERARLDFRLQLFPGKFSLSLSLISLSSLSRLSLISLITH